jgi:hypothetical protein
MRSGARALQGADKAKIIGVMIVIEWGVRFP